MKTDTHSKTTNLFQLNDWKFDKFIKIIFVIQISLIGLIILDKLGFEIPIFRQVIGFVYLSFVPGFILLRVMKLHKLGEVKTILYALGLSISTMMFLTFLMNGISLFFSIQNPISLDNFVIVLLSLVSLLLLLSYIRDNKFSSNTISVNKEIFNPYVLLITLLPFLSIIGARLVTNYNNNFLIFILIPIVSMVPILVAFNKISKKSYPLILFSISIALIYHSALISNYMWGWDINVEYNLANTVIKNAVWNPNLESDVNAMLSVVNIAPLYSLILNMDLTWVFKIIYPFIYCFVPLGLYEVYRSQTSDKIGFFSCFFFIGFSFFYFNAVTGARQEIAELFLVLFLIVIFNEKVRSWKNSIIVIIFIISLAVSHYGTSYLWMFILIGTGIYLTLTNYLNSEKGNDNILNLNIVTIFIVFSLIWYIYIAGSYNFETIVRIGSQISNNLVDNFLNPEYSQGLNIVISEQYSPIASFEKYLNILFQFFITIGLFYIVKFKKYNFKKAYLLFSLIFFAFLISGIFVPLFSNQLNTTRLYHMSQIILSPFMVIGAIKIFELFRLFNFNLKPTKILAILLTIFLLVNTAWIYGIFNEYPQSIRSIALYQNNINNGSDDAKNNFYAAFNTEMDINGVKWLSQNKYNSLDVYADHAKIRLTLKSYGMIENADELYHESINKPGYIFLGFPNVKHGIIYGSGPNNKNYWHITKIESELKEKNLIYENSGVKIFFEENK